MSIQSRPGSVLVLAAGLAIFALSPAMAQTFDITPVTPKNVASPVGGPASPGSLVYTVHNTGATPLTVTAEKVDVTGAPATYAWIDLGSATVGPLDPGASGTITATFNTAAVASGRYEAFVKFKDSPDGTVSVTRTLRLYDGTPVPCYDEAFSYPDASLNGVGGWTGSTGSQIMLSGQKAVLTYDNNYRGTTLTRVLPTPVSGNTILWHASVQYTGTGSGGNAFDLRLEDTAGNAFARWYGGSSWERPRIGDGGCVLGNGILLGPGVWNDLLVTIDTVAKTSTFKVNDTVLGTLSYGGTCSAEPSNAVGRIRIGFQNAGTAQNGDTKLYDNIWVRADNCDTVCSESLTPAAGSVSVAEVGAAAVPPTQAFTVTNTNSLDASYAVATVDVNGAPATYGWFALDKTAGPTLSPEATDSVTATMDTTGLPGDEYVGFLKFTNTCNATVWYRPIELQVLGSNCLLEKFPYMAGPLNGQPGWSGADSTGAITILSDRVVRLSGYVASGNGPLITAVHQTGGCSCEAGKRQLQIVSVKVRGHTGGSRFWELHFLDSLGNDLAAWRGTAGSVEAYVRGFALPVSGLLTPLTGGGQFDTLEATINTNDTAINGLAANTTLFTLIYASGTRNVLGTISHGSALAPPVQNVRFSRLVNNVSGDSDPVIDFDDLIVQKCTAQCQDPVFDVRNIDNEAVADGMVDSHDLRAFEACATGPGIAISAELLTPEQLFECKCMDVNRDNAIDQIDFAAFDRCYSGNALLDPNCGN
jgi:hypothetical protein